MRRTIAELMKHRLSLPAPQTRRKDSPRTLVERAEIKNKMVVRQSRWRGWQARYPELNKADHKLCSQCNRILNRDQFNSRGKLCKWCKYENKRRASL